MNNVKRPVSPRLPFRFRRPAHCRGQTLVEYALVLSIISIVIVGLVFNLGKEINTVYSGIDSQVARAPTSASNNPFNN